MRRATWLLFVAACGRDVFHCTESNQCTVGDATAGRCEPEGYCSFPDDSCPSGFRFGEFAPDELADQCAGIPDGGNEPVSSVYQPLSQGWTRGRGTGDPTVPDR